MIPENIPPARRVVKFLAVVFLVCGLPLVFAFLFLLYELIFYYPQGSDLYNKTLLLSVLTVALLALQTVAGGYLLRSPERHGASVNFVETGFTLRIRALLRRDRDHNLDWANVRDIVLFRVGPINEDMKIRTVNGETVLLPMLLVATSSDETLARFRTSANTAGYRLEKTGGFNALIVARQTWSVSRHD